MNFKNMPRTFLDIKRQMSNLQHLVFSMKYAQPDNNGKFENLNQAMSRYLKCITTELKSTLGFELNQTEYLKIKRAMCNLDVLPSMRALATANSRTIPLNNAFAYNCGYLTIDSIQAFSETLYLQLCGVGLGYSIEKKNVYKLPVVPLLSFDDNQTLCVADSREGWKVGLNLLMTALYSGVIPKVGFSKIRPHNSIVSSLHVNAIGFEPIEQLFSTIVEIFKGAQGRKLKPIECHKILCNIGKTISTNGTRRSALMALFDFDDTEMLNAKVGDWWAKNPEFSFANNSVVFDEANTTRADFERYWTAISTGMSGEPGFFNRFAANKKIESYRGTFKNLGTNPCCEILLQPNQFCNLSEVVIRPNDDLQSLKKKLEIAAIFGTLQSGLNNFTDINPMWTFNTSSERLLGVSLTGIFDNELTRETITPKQLQELKQVVVDTNNVWSKLMKIAPSKSATCIKPSGSVSLLAECSSGIHPPFGKYWIRRVRVNRHSVVGEYLSRRIPFEPCLLDSKNTLIFSFPQQSSSTINRNICPIEHLRIILKYQDHYCTHKPSATISVPNNMWTEVGKEIVANLDKVIGVTFLPTFGGNYKQAPLEECSFEEYKLLEQQQQQKIDWNDFYSKIELRPKDMSVECTGPSCNF